MPAASSALAQLLDRRSAFHAFLVARLGNAAEAEDVLQNGLLKAVQRADEVRDNDKITAWFYQVLRHAIVDHVRSRNSTAIRDEAWTTQSVAMVDDDAGHKAVCACFEAILPDLKPREAELLRRVELQNETVADAARPLGLTANNASVILHRARANLRRKLEAFCGACAKGACLDCDCRPDATRP